MSGSSSEGPRPAGDELPDDQILDHLQAAARELIGAARAALDAVEGAVDDPRRLVAQWRNARSVPGERPRVEKVEVTEEPPDPAES